MGDRRLHGIAGITQVAKVNAFDDPPILDVETGDDADLEHSACRCPKLKGLPICRYESRRFEVPTPPAANSVRNFKSKSGTGIIELLVPLCFRSSCQWLLRCITNFGSGALGVELPGHNAKRASNIQHRGADPLDRVFPRAV